jgi:peptidoglycan hydrolase-like protein with peptidoglycan-binding domain
MEAAQVYTLTAFIREVQTACGAKVDGIAGPETIGKTVTLSAIKNSRHEAVKPVQKRLAALGYSQVGEADGIAGPKFTAAVKEFQRVNRCWVDGEITAANQTWRKLLGME